MRRIVAGSVAALRRIPTARLASSSEPWLFEPAKRERHVLSFTTRDTCGLEGGVASEHFTLASVAIDVVGLR